ncbi:hypothetical protein KDL44_04125 [bacterium]|nr:hypothetical protein [bacterium]
MAEELKATRVRVQDLELQVEDLSERISNIASQLGKLTKVVRQLMSGEYPAQNGSGQPAPEPAVVPPGPSPDPEIPTPRENDIPREMLQAIRMITENRSEDAQKIVTSQPREMLADHPGIVALVAASLRIHKGEFGVARAALDKARKLITDQRLIKVVRFLEKQIPAE